MGRRRRREEVGGCRRDKSTGRERSASVSSRSSSRSGSASEEVKMLSIHSSMSEEEQVGGAGQAVNNGSPSNSKYQKLIVIASFST